MQSIQAYRPPEGLILRRIWQSSRSVPTYTVRTVIRWAKRPEQARKFLYEERITAWNAESIEAAIDEAGKEAREYAGDDSEALDLFQGYQLFDEIGLLPQGAEVFSLLRESDMEPSAYLDAFFDTGEERQAGYDPDPDSA